MSNKTNAAAPVKVSVIMPSLNVAKYIRRCMESVLCQTLREIEILCVDAGSTDGTLEILQEYAQKDTRITLLHSDVKSYGYQMNLGMDAARGEYMGIVETDDFAEPNMFESLYETARRNACEVVKGGFFYYWSTPEERDEPAPIASKTMAKRTFCPRRDFHSPLEMAEFYNIKPTIWSAIYQLEFLRREHIRFHETPGASFQDASFNFKVFACARRVRLMEECFLHYRQDNEASSVNSPGKVYCVAEEYQEIERFLCEEKPELRGKLEGIRLRLKFDIYLWNYNRLGAPLNAEFLAFASQDLRKDMASGYCEKQYFPWYKWNQLLALLEGPQNYLSFMERAEKLQNAQVDIEGSLPRRLLHKVKRGFECVQEHGLCYTLRLGLSHVFHFRRWLS